MSAIYKAYDGNKKSLTRFLRRFLDRPEDAEDALQDAFLKAFVAERTTTINNPRAFLFKTARNVALNKRKKQINHATDTVVDFDALGVIDSMGTPEKRADIGERLHQALQVIEQLSPRVQEVFILRKVRGLKQREIAEQLGIAESTVEKHIAKGLLKITGFLESEKNRDTDSLTLKQILQARPAEVKS